VGGSPGLRRVLTWPPSGAHLASVGRSPGHCRALLEAPKATKIYRNLTTRIFWLQHLLKSMKAYNQRINAYNRTIHPLVGSIGAPVGRSPGLRRALPWPPSGARLASVGRSPGLRRALAWPPSAVNDCGISSSSSSSGSSLEASELSGNVVLIFQVSQF
jgi:hypothetical protein